MADFELTPTRPLSDGAKELLQTAFSTLDYSEATHLLDIFKGEKKDLTRYYGEDVRKNGNIKKIVEALVRDHQEDVAGLLNRLDNQFCRSNVKKNQLEQNLVERGISGDFVLAVEPTRRRLVLFAYHLYYNTENFDDQLKALELQSRLFKETTERTYKYGRDRAKVNNLEQRVQKYVERRNDQLYRPFTIKYSKWDEHIYLDFYKEVAQVYENVFEERQGKTQAPNSGVPEVTQEPRFPIKTLHLKIDTSSEEEVKFVYKTNPKSGWKLEIERFFDYTFSIEDPFDESNQKIDYGASEVLETAMDTARDDDTDEEDVEETIADTMQTMAEEAGDDDLPEITTDDIRWVGIVVDDDDNTMIKYDDFTVKTDIPNYLKNTPGARERLFHIINEVDDDNLGLRIRSNLGDGQSEDFIVWRKHWEEDARVDDSTRQSLNTIFKRGENGE
jgi:uncharacterized protein YcnI